MKTDELIAMLAANASPVPPHATARRFAMAISLGAPVALLAMISALGIRTDIGQSMQAPIFLVKLAFPSLIAAAALFAATRLARPGRPLGRVPLVMASALLLLWAATGMVLAEASPGERSSLVFGGTWISCPINIALLSLPLFLAIVWAMKGLAPTRLRLAGAAAGLLAGAISAALYVLHCTEMDLPFLGIWYVAGMLLPAAGGALLGRWMLRW